KIILIDNYDSFTYNIAQCLRTYPKVSLTVQRNDQVILDELERFDAIVLSPGPGLPNEAGDLLAIISQYLTKKPILGICLGHQALAQVAGAELLNLEKVYHGINSTISIDNTVDIFSGLADEISVGRYHSWVIDENKLDSSYKICARTRDGQIMAIAHQKYPVFGLQFHPESIMTPKGAEIIHNFLRIAETKSIDREQSTLSTTL
ncbi:MAG: aminodeoxychorismate/anthranilate synthase component II, partial [Saprospiraceae bacterium]|nr:aminodeoxychorismate/anthranilate synthase component II [Saprospiraceae bacterium]